MKIDTHQHFWTNQRTDYATTCPRKSDFKPHYLPEDIVPLIAAHDVAGVIAIQGINSLAETEFLLALPSSHILGVMGWVNPDNDASMAKSIAQFALNPRFKGVRFVLPDYERLDWVSSVAMSNLAGRLSEYNLALELYACPEHLEHVSALMSQHPHLTLILDAAGRPYMAQGAFDEWAHEIVQLAQYQNVYIKVTPGFLSCCENAPDKAANFYVEHLKTHYAKRLMWGSEWPCAAAFCDYETGIKRLKAFFADDSEFWLKAACQAYGLDISKLGRANTAAERVAD